MFAKKHGFSVTAEREDEKFEGSFVLPHEINTRTVKAEFKEGLLKFKAVFMEPLEGTKVTVK